MTWGAYGLKLGPTAESPLYVAARHDAYPIGEGQFWLVDRDRGGAQGVTAEVLQALRLCSGFDTLERHVARVCSQLTPLRGQETVVRGVLQELARSGLLVRADAWLERVRAAPARATVQFRTLMLRTCERPLELAVLLQSLSEHGRRWGTRYRCVLVDMSRKSETIARNRQLLQDYAELAGVPVRHVDRSCQAEWLGTLCEALPEHATGLRHLLGDAKVSPGFHGDYGVSLNWIHLLGAGERYVLMDDDHQFPLRWHPGWQSGIDLADLPEPPLVVEGLDQALSWGLDRETDPLELHASLCGHSLSTLLGSGPTALRVDQLQGVVPGEWANAESQPSVLATAQGHRGDTSSMSLIWMMALPASARSAALLDPENYLRSLQRPAVVQAASRFRRVASLGLSPFMLDGSQLMPATPPAGRGEDSVFSALLAALHRDGMQIELPMAIGHRRPSAPEREGFLDQPSTPAVAVVLADLIRDTASSLSSSCPHSRLRALCAVLEEHAAAESAQAAAMLQERLRAYRARTLAGLRHALQDTPVPPPHLARDLERLIRANASGLADDAPARFADWPAGLTAQSGADLWRDYLSRFASALRVWPDAVGVARDLSTRWLGSQ